MASYIVDTNVISQLAPGRTPPDEKLLAWMVAREDALFLSVITPIEIGAGVLKLGRIAPGRRHAAIAEWFQDLETDFADRILPLTRGVVRHVVEIADRHAAKGLHPGWPDVVIAATAQFHGMSLLTRNVRHFAEAGIPVIDPFQSLPE